MQIMRKIKDFLRGIGLCGNRLVSSLALYYCHQSDKSKSFYATFQKMHDAKKITFTHWF